MIERLDTLSQQLAAATDIANKMRKSMPVDSKLQCAKRMWIDMQLQLLIREKKDTELLENLKHAQDSQLNDHTWMQQQIQASHRQLMTTDEPKPDYYNVLCPFVHESTKYVQIPNKLFIEHVRRRSRGAFNRAIK